MKLGDNFVFIHSIVKHDLKSQYWYRPKVCSNNIANIGIIDHNQQYHTLYWWVNIISIISKSDTILPKYIGIVQYLEPCFKIKLFILEFSYCEITDIFSCFNFFSFFFLFLHPVLDHNLNNLHNSTNPKTSDHIDNIYLLVSSLPNLP